jgi:hypothetical protein
VVGVAVPGGTSHPPGIYLHGRQLVGLLAGVDPVAAQTVAGLCDVLDGPGTPVVCWPGWDGPNREAADEQAAQDENFG